MLHLYTADYHGKAGGLEKALSQLNPDVFGFLGDYDTPGTLRLIKRLEQEQISRGKRVISVPGNHDHAFRTRLKIDSKLFKKDPRKLYEDIKNDPEAWEYLQNLMRTKESLTESLYLDRERFGEDYNTIILHGALDGKVEIKKRTFPPEVTQMWTRLNTEEDHLKNFRAMEGQGYDVMIRGHDHVRQLASYKDGEIVEITSWPSEGPIELKNDMLYTITVGPMFRGNFATIHTDSQNPILQFRKTAEFLDYS